MHPATLTAELARLVVDVAFAFFLACCGLAILGVVVIGVVGLLEISRGRE